MSRESTIFQDPHWPSRPCQRTFNGTNHFHHLHVSPYRRIDRPSLHVFGRPDGGPNHPYDGHNNNQRVCGHHSLLAGNHRTLQAFYQNPPSWGAETWVDDRHSQRGEEVIWNDPVDVCLPCSGHLDSGRPGGRRADNYLDLRHA